MLRRTFLQTLSAGAMASLPVRGAGGVPHGIDAYSIRAFDWTAMRLLEYAAGLKLDSIQMSAPGDYESIEAGHLAKVKRRADELGVAIDAAIGKICPTTGRWNRRESPEEYIRMGVGVARAVGSKSVRVYVGGIGDRGGDPPWEAHMESTLKVIRGVRSLLLDSGVKLAIENHGDFEARELKAFIEVAGTDIVGCCLDSGNPMRVLEDPLLTLEVLAPYALTSHIRDSVVYAHPRGAAFQWVALGDGSIDFKRFARRYTELCPNVPIQHETITGRPPTVLPYLEDDYWKRFPGKPAADFARFVKLVKEGRPFMGSMMIGGPGQQPPEYAAALREQQRVDLERSIQYARETLGVGRA